MAHFVKDTEINLILEDLIKEAEELLVFFCPYFKLHQRVKDSLKLRKDDPELRIIVVFGKNENDPSKSLNKEDFEFLKSFPWVDVAYEKRLHAKYYANEKQGVITSLNLLEFSQNNNIEVGVLFESKGMLKKLTDRTLGGLASMISDTEDLAPEAQSFFISVFRNAEKIFAREPVFKSSFFNLTKSYSHSEVTCDRTAWFEEQVGVKPYPQGRPSIGFHARKEPNYESEGFCIRTREKIAFNPSKPLSYSAYQVWAEFGNPDYKEKYCHRCGTSVRTTVNNPLCKQCDNRM